MNNISTPGIRFIVTSLCNYGCDYCHNEWEPKRRSKSKLEGKLIEELIDAAKQLGAVEVDVTGGEPLLEPERVRTIFETAKRKEMWTNLTTNGYFLERDSSWLAGIGLDEMHVHIPSLDPRLYRTLMKGNADLDKVLRGLHTVKAAIPVMKANIPIQMSVNEAEIPRFVVEFNRQGITPRFIETMATESFETNGQRAFDEVVQNQLGGKASLKNSYLWGINEYESSSGRFETLRCICFDRKCDVCPTTNFIHVDSDYRIRPCNLRQFRIQAQEGKCLDQVGDAIKFLQKQTDIPEEYVGIWGKNYVPLMIGGNK